MPIVKVDAYQCERCGHIWLPLRGGPAGVGPRPKVCPNQQCPDRRGWDRPRVYQRRERTYADQT